MSAAPVIARLLAIMAMLQPVTGVLAQAPRRCLVNDPSATPLNLRASPGGAVLGRVENRESVEITEQTVDERGRSWAKVTVTTGATAGRQGWVFREFIACF